MGADYTGYAFIGQKLNKSKLTKSVTVPGCSHKNPKHANFCAACGAKAFVTEKRSVVDTDDGNFGSTGLKVIESTDRNELFVALPNHFVETGSSNCGDDTGYTPLSNIAVQDAHDKIKYVLEHYDLWDEKNFGLWTVLYCSY